MEVWVHISWPQVHPTVPFLSSQPLPILQYLRRLWIRAICPWLQPCPAEVAETSYGFLWTVFSLEVVCSSPSCCSGTGQVKPYIYGVFVLWLAFWFWWQGGITKLNSLLGLPLWSIQWLGLCASIAGNTGLIPGWRTELPRAVWHSQKKRPKSLLSSSSFPVDVQWQG